MVWTLDNALQECARNTYNTKTMVRSGSAYSGKGAEYVKRFVSGINYAINKICREKFGIVQPNESIAIDDKGRFDISSLSKSCILINSITYNDTPLTFEVDATERVWVDGQSSNNVLVTYEYLPVELTTNDLDTVLPIDQRYIDPRVLCQYANYQFLSEEGTEYDSARAQVWLGLFNDSFVNLVSPNRLPRRVKYRG